MPKTKSKFVVIVGSRQVAWTKSKSKKTIDSILADEYRKKHKVSVGRLRPVKKK